MRGQAWIMAGVATVSAFCIAPQAQAQSYGGGYTTDAHCEQQRQQRALWGAVIGGVGGALLGREVAARNARNSGTILGGLAGAGAGAAIGHNSANCQTALPAQQPYQGYNQSYPQDYGPSSGRGSDGWGYDSRPYNTGGGYPDLRGGPAGGQNCRFGDVITRDPSGREIADKIYMCRGADGVWRPA